MDEMKLFCKENMISWIPKGSGVISCIKIIPKGEYTKFFSFTIFEEEKWAVSVWTDVENHRKLKIYLENTCGMSMIEAANVSFRTFNCI